MTRAQVGQRGKEAKRAGTAGTPDSFGIVQSRAPSSRDGGATIAASITYL